MKTAYAIVAGALLSSSAAFANVVYDEAVDGDLAQYADKGISLSQGKNLVLGSAFVDADFDSFYIEIPDGHKLNSIAYKSNADYEVRTGYTISVDGLDEISSDGFLISPGGEVSFFEDVMLLEAGIYELFHYMKFALLWDYSWTFNVTGPDTEMPEPAALALFGLGPAGLGLRRRKGGR